MTKKAKTPIAVRFDRYEIFEIKPQTAFTAIDLGLPSGRLWAAQNVGAHAMSDYGLLMDFDTANAIEFLDGWHLPTKEDFQELYDSCTSEWTTINGNPGRMFTSKINGHQIFLPAAGWSWFDDDEHGSTLYNRGTLGDYWSSSYYSATGAYYLHFNSSAVFPQGNDYRRNGFSVRAVQ